VTDRITVAISENEKVAAALAAHQDYVASEVLADAVEVKAGVTGSPTDLGGDVGEIQVALTKV